MAKPVAQRYEPDYICWHENDFMADRQVARMTPHQRLMYRSLCQAGMFCSTRPYLPDDDNELFLLADADSVEQWKQNREAVLVKFQRVEVAGKPMLAHKRLLSDWARIIEVVNQKRAAASRGGQARAKQLANAWQPDSTQMPAARLAGDSQSKTESETETQTESESETESETITNDNSKYAGSVAGHSQKQNRIVKTDIQEHIVTLFESYVGEMVHDSVFDPLLSCHDPQKVASVMRWAFTRSNHWAKGKSGEITSAQEFVRAFPKIEQQYDKYYISAAKKPHEVEDDFSAPDSEGAPPDEDSDSEGNARSFKLILEDD